MLMANFFFQVLLYLLSASEKLQVSYNVLYYNYALPNNLSYPFY